MNACPDHVAPVVPLTLLSEDFYRFAVEKAADTALATGRPAVAVGLSDGYIVVCVDGRCHARPGGVIAVPDTLIVEVAANHTESWTPTTRLRRPDGRSVSLYRTGGGAA